MHHPDPPCCTPDGCAALAAAAGSVLDECELLVLAVSDAAYTGESRALRGGTVGKHLRHTLDHFAAALSVVSQPGVIDYDRRQRNVPMETDRAAALAAIADLRDKLTVAAGAGLHAPVSVRVMVTAMGDEAQLQSTLGRELAFATHHAIHHQAMMRAIAGEFGIETLQEFGKAPSTIKSERGS
jgi:uncharacterized damage-inducible protein DinB